MPYRGPRTWPANPQDTLNYANDLEEWLLGGLMMEPELFPQARQYLNHHAFSRELHQWIWMAMEKFYTHRNLHDTRALHPLTIAMGVPLICQELFPNSKPYPYRDVAAHLSSLLREAPPLMGSLDWIGQELNRLAEERGVKPANLTFRKLKEIEV